MHAKRTTISKYTLFSPIYPCQPSSHIGLVITSFADLRSSILVPRRASHGNVFVPFLAILAVWLHHLSTASVMQHVGTCGVGDLLARFGNDVEAITPNIYLCIRHCRTRKGTSYVGDCPRQKQASQAYLDLEWSYVFCALLWLQ